MYKKILFLFLLIVGLSCSVHAQDNYPKENALSYISFGIRLGGGFSKFHGMDRYGDRIAGTSIYVDRDINPRFGAAWDIGLSVQTMFKERLLIQYDLSVGFSNTTFRNTHFLENEPIKRLMHDNTNLTIFAGTKLALNSDVRFVLGAGPYVGFDFMNLISGNSGSTEVIYNGILETVDGDYKSYDLGAAIMGGIEYRNIQIAINYHHGLLNIVNDEFPVYNRVFKLVGTYYF